MLFKGTRYGVEIESLVSVFSAFSTKRDKIWHCTIDAVSFPKIASYGLSVALITFDGIL